MKYTRRSFIKNAGLAGMTVLLPSSLSWIYSNPENKADYFPGKSDDNSDFRVRLERYFMEASSYNRLPDILIINLFPVTEYGYVFLRYEKGRDEAPVVLLCSDYTGSVICGVQKKEQVCALIDISRRYGVFICYEEEIRKWFEENNDAISVEKISHDLVKRINTCGEFNYISEELYSPVSVAYVLKLRGEYYRNKMMA